MKLIPRTRQFKVTRHTGLEIPFSGSSLPRDIFPLMLGRHLMFGYSFNQLAVDIAGASRANELLDALLAFKYIRKQASGYELSAETLETLKSSLKLTPNHRTVMPRAEPTMPVPAAFNVPTILDLVREWKSLLRASGKHRKVAFERTVAATFRVLCREYDPRQIMASMKRYVANGGTCGQITVADFDKRVRTTLRRK